MDLFSPFHLIILLLIVVLLFGTSKLKKMGPDLGNAVRGFKKALRGDEDDADEAAATKSAEKLQADPPPAKQARTADAPQQERSSVESK